MWNIKEDAQYQPWRYDTLFTWCWHTWHSIYMVLLNSQASTAKNKFDWAVEVLQTSLSDAYVVSTGQLASSESVNVISKTEQKATELDHLQNFMKEKLTTAKYSEKIQILTLAPDSWSCWYCAEHFNVSEYQARTARELKKVKGILAYPAQKQGKVISQNTIDLVLSMYQNNELSHQMKCLVKKTTLSLQKEFMKRLFLCNLREMYAAFKEKYPNGKLRFSKFCTFQPKWCVVLGLQVLILYVYAVSIKMQFY